MTEHILCPMDGWKLTWMAHQDTKQGVSITTYDQLCAMDTPVIDAIVPGNVELDMMRAGHFPKDIFVGTNVEKERELEKMHFWYGCRFQQEGPVSETAFLKFDGIDTFADIYLNGALIASTDNMMISYEVEAKGLREGQNELVVHIRPVNIVARSLPSTPLDYHNSYNYANLRVRKAAHTFGWDIMPRVMSAGLWRDVWIGSHEKDEIEECYFYTSRVADDESEAEVALYFRTTLEQDDTLRYAIRLDAVCEDSVISETWPLWFSNGKQRFRVYSPKVWHLTGYGAPNLYNATLTLLLDGQPVNTKSFRFGIRTIQLENSSATDLKGSGKFHFLVNGKRVYILGTNWTPLDPYHSRDKERLTAALDLAVELGCNAFRCWGGNVYEDHEFFDYCDEHGIMVWQDFGMACAIHPNEETLEKQLHEECVSVVKRLRQHPSLGLWAGDNECDVAFSEWIEFSTDPNSNHLTRVVIPEVLRAEDPARSYLPSSPYVAEALFCMHDNRYIPENHLWNALPRDNFKSDFYANTMAHFVSEIGWFGSVSPESARQFLSPECVWPADNAEWIIHCAPPESKEGQYTFRRKIFFDQARYFFGLEPANFDEFALASQIIQAEAYKYFIESFRMKKPRTSGIIWWNLIDGWPQFSDAVVDYYYRKKLAFSYIQRSQQHLCLMFSEPVDHRICLKAVNEDTESTPLSYEVWDVTNNQKVCSASGVALADAVTTLTALTVNEYNPCLYIVKWNAGEFSGMNHYLLGKPPFSLQDVAQWLKRADLLKMDGFDSASFNTEG